MRPAASMHLLTAFRGTVHELLEIREEPDSTSLTRHPEHRLLISTNLVGSATSCQHSDRSLLLPGLPGSSFTFVVTVVELQRCLWLVHSPTGVKMNKVRSTLSNRCIPAWYIRSLLCQRPLGTSSTHFASSSLHQGYSFYREFPNRSLAVKGPFNRS